MAKYSHSGQLYINQESPTKFWVMDRMGSIHSKPFKTLAKAESLKRKREGKTKNPASTWFKLDHPHALAVVDNEIQLMSSKKLTNPQKKKFKSFVAKVRRALSNPGTSSYTYASQTHSSLGWYTQRTFKTLASAKKDAREMARDGETTRVMNKNTGTVYASYKAK